METRQRSGKEGNDLGLPSVAKRMGQAHMKIPYVIDNQNNRMADILNTLLTEHRDRSLDVATAYFNVGGFGLLKEGLSHLGSFRLLLGAEPAQPSQIGLNPFET